MCLNLSITNCLVLQLKHLSTLAGKRGGRLPKRHSSKTDLPRFKLRRDNPISLAVITRMFYIVVLKIEGMAGCNSYRRFGRKALPSDTSWRPVMAEWIQTEKPRRKSFNPEAKEIAEDLENHARILQESGRLNDAANLREWARELRQKAQR